jgi:L-alanine-DL-glutamate epimerase-like enolase superfamily enzyme
MKLSWSRISLSLAGKFRTSQAIRTDKQTIWVKITHDQIEGWGESVPMETYQQTLESSETALSRIEPLLRDINPFELESTSSLLLSQFDDQRATVAAVDAALHDWIGRRLGLPTWQYLGLSPSPIPLTSYSIGIEDLDQMEQKLRESSDYPILKIKLGLGNDEEILKLIRRFAPEKKLRVDANKAWTLDEALAKLPLLAAHNVEFLEQPLASDNIDGMRKLREKRLCPIVADESCIRPADIPALAGNVDGINIKLSKCGGIREAHRMITIAKALNLKVMLGCMIESSLGISAALQLASLADWLDLDGHLLLSHEPFSGIAGQAGKLIMGPNPGLGTTKNKA